MEIFCARTQLKHSAKKCYFRPFRLDRFQKLQSGASALGIGVITVENQRQVTNIGGANFAPYWHPSGEKIIFSSNHDDPDGRDFDLYMINLDGTGLTQITYSEGFDGFPAFSPDGRYLVFGSNRNNGDSNDTNVFIAEWVE